MASQGLQKEIMLRMRRRILTSVQNMFMSFPRQKLLLPSQYCSFSLNTLGYVIFLHLGGFADYHYYFQASWYCKTSHETPNTKFQSIQFYTVLGWHPILILRSDPYLSSCLRFEQIALRLCPSRSRSWRVDNGVCWSFQDYIELPNFLAFLLHSFEMFGNLAIAEVRNWGRRGFSVPGRRELAT